MIVEKIKTSVRMAGEDTNIDVDFLLMDDEDKGLKVECVVKATDKKGKKSEFRFGSIEEMEYFSKVFERIAHMASRW